MRGLMWLAVLALVAAPVLSAPSIAYADGIERPNPRPRAPRRAPAPPLLGAPEAPRVETDSNVVVLPASFFAGATGGVGADIGVGASSSTVVIVRGGSASASAFASASARAGVGVGARGGHGGRGGGCACR